jgi:hypothetical protein
MQHKQRIIRGTPQLPVNSTAMKVTSSGYVFDPTKHGTPHNGYTCSDEMPTLRSGSNVVPDLSGRRFGKFRVIGLSDKPGRWVVQCQCGKYELRSAKAIKNPSNNQDACLHCRHETFLAKELRRMCYEQPPQEAKS